MKRSFDHSFNMHVANVLALLSSEGGGGGGGGGRIGDRIFASPDTSSGRVFECKTCCRQFPSFQALGGHRASHKKPRPSGDDSRAHAAPAPAKAKVHECSVCGLEFAIGQALGGHMSKHRSAAEVGGKGHGDDGKKRVLFDLNLPPLEVELGLGLGLVCS